MSTRHLQPPGLRRKSSWLGISRGLTRHPSFAGPHLTVGPRTCLLSTPPPSGPCARWPWRTSFLPIGSAAGLPISRVPAAVGWGQAAAGTGGNIRLIVLNQYLTILYLRKPCISASCHFCPADWTPIDTLIELRGAEIGLAGAISQQGCKSLPKSGATKSIHF